MCHIAVHSSDPVETKSNERCEKQTPEFAPLLYKKLLRLECDNLKMYIPMRLQLLWTDFISNIEWECNLFDCISYVVMWPGVSTDNPRENVHRSYANNKHHQMVQISDKCARIDRYARSHDFCEPIHPTLVRLAHEWQPKEKITNFDISAKSSNMRTCLCKCAFASTRIIICYSSDSYQGWGQQKSRDPMKFA